MTTQYRNAATTECAGGVPEGNLILADGISFSRDTLATGVNNNVLIIGTSGSGKTRSVISPNILQASGSYIVSDPKGTLKRKYGHYLKRKGYKVLTLDLMNPAWSTHYNPMAHLQTDEDIVRFAHMLTYLEDSMEGEKRLDPFWDQSSQMLLTALTGYLVNHCQPADRTIHSLNKILTLSCINEDNPDRETVLDRMFKDAVSDSDQRDSLTSRCYQFFRQAPGRTARSILITLSAKISSLDTGELQRMMCRNDIDFTLLDREKTALFLTVSDSDRSRDVLGDIIVTQCMQSLMSYADKNCVGQRLPVPVTFILDDFATNVKIPDFPKIISTIRSRGISTMLSLQNEGQLTNLYGAEGTTVIGNSDTILYLGGNDVDTARDIAVRADQPVTDILNMGVGENWIFRKGQAPVHGRNFRLEPFERAKLKEVGIEMEDERGL